MSLELVLAVARRAQRLYQTSEAAQVIAELWNALKDVHADVARAHFASAQSAFAAAAESRDPALEVRSAIAHLRDAFHVYQALLQRRRTRRRFIFFAESVSVLNPSETVRVEGSLFEIALCIALTYVDLGERENALTWKVAVETYLTGYLEAATIGFTADYLHSIDRNLVEMKGRMVYEPSGYSTSKFKYETWFEVNDAGRAYIKETKRELVEKTNEIFRLKELV